MELKINPEFESKIPPLDADELKLLEENILSEGVVINPIITWNGVIVDGHNRYHIIQRHPEIKFTIHEKQFEHQFEALAWICKNQLGRRNLTPEQKKYLIGKQYEAEKLGRGGDRKSENAKSKGQNVHLISEQRTSERIAQENGVNEKYVRRAAHFTKGVDIADEVAPGIRQEILTGAIKPTDAAIASVVRADPEERPALVEQLRNPPKKEPSVSAKKASTSVPDIKKISEEMLTARGKASLDDVLYELEDALESMIFRWSMCLRTNADIYSSINCREEINKLVKTGNEFFNQIKGGKIPE